MVGNLKKKSLVAIGWILGVIVAYFIVLSFLSLIHVMPFNQYECYPGDYPYPLECAVYSVYSYSFRNGFYFFDRHNWLLLVAVTLALAWYARISSDISRRQTRIASETLRHNKRMERAYLGVEKFHLTRRPKSSIEDPNSWYISIEFINTGRSPAQVEKVEINIVPAAELPEIPDYSGCNPLIFPLIVPAGKACTTEPPVGTIHEGKEVPCVVFGRVIYKDLEGIERRTGFAMDIDTHMLIGGAIKNQAYTYFD